MSADDYVIRVLESPLDIPADQWNALLALQATPTPFMRHEYLAALHQSACASPSTGWTPRFVTLWREGTSSSEATQLVAACALYLKSHSRGEYVFDWAWASAYAQHGMAYYPKALVAVPFTPVPGTRLLAISTHARQALLRALLDCCRDLGLPSLHLLFLDTADQVLCQQQGLMLRHTVQFHWHNQAWRDFDDFLASLKQPKRKKVLQERRKVSDAGVQVRSLEGRDIGASDWDFFYTCYERTYLEHGNPPYLSRAFFQQIADTMPQHWLLFLAERHGTPIAASLIGLSGAPTPTTETHTNVAYGRYWGALERVDCLHFELCYYQPLQWCIANGIQRFEGGAQGEHKMSRALLPSQASSAHWLADARFATAVAAYLQREREGVADYLNHLEAHSPMRHTD